MKEFDVVERGIIIKLFYNKELHPYLEDLLPGIFTNSLLRGLAYAMKSIYLNQGVLNIDSLSMFVNTSNEMRQYEKRKKIETVTGNDVSYVFVEEAMGLDTSPKRFKEGYEHLLEKAFRLFSARMADEIKYCTEKFGQEANIKAYAHAINLQYDMLYKRKFKVYEDQIAIAAHKINQAGNFIPTFSSALNANILGFSRGYPDSLLARSQHCKSTFISNQSRFLIKKKVASEVTIISTEELVSDFWQRMYALECKLSIHGMRSGVIKIADEHIQIIKDLYQNRIKVYNVIKYKDVVDLLYSLDSEFIVIDHINAIQFEGRGDAIQNMIGGIPNLITAEKNFLEINKDTSIVNVNQVREKTIDSEIKHRWKRPNYTMAFANSTMYIAAREWVTLYYPYKDVVNRPKEWVGAKKIPTANELYAYIEKNSFGGNMGESTLHIIPDFAIIEDGKITNTDYIPPKNLTEKEKELGW